MSHFNITKSPFGERNQPGLANALGQFRLAFVGVGLFSALINLLMLTGAFFMLQIYDRVLPSRSVSTLLGLAAIALGLYAFQGLLDLIRSRVLVRIASAFQSSLSDKVTQSWPTRLLGISSNSYFALLMLSVLSLTRIGMAQFNVAEKGSVLLRVTAR